MESNFTFDVLILSPKSGWTSVSRWENADRAREEARKLVASDKHEGVKILQEHFDYVENRFREKTIFLRTRTGNRQPEAPPEEEFYVAPDRIEPLDRNRPLFTWIGGIAAALALVLVVGLFYFSHEGGHRHGYDGDLTSYELPTIRTNVSLGNETYAVQMSLQMELYDPDDAERIEENLSPITETIIDELQKTSAADLNNSAKLQHLREVLRDRISDVLGGMRFDSLLFKDIQVRLR